jgi:3-dehydroquinate synthase
MIYSGKDSLQQLSQFLNAIASSCYILVDDNTFAHCYPKIKTQLPVHSVIQTTHGEENKTLSTCELIWAELTEKNADRTAFLINLGGGVICDIGGFAAGCYKRGIKFINVPTTLLAMVDASVGGKTGIDFKGYKNQVGLFNDPEAVFIYSGFLETLDARELRSGFAEVIKHYLIADKVEFDKLVSQKTPLRDIDFDRVIAKAIEIKSAIVEKDPKEQNTRKALNFGHTIGHAVESVFLTKDKDKLLHGEAVAIGMITESFISMKKSLLNQHELEQITVLIRRYIETPVVPQNDSESILKLIKQDKKNAKDQNQFTLLRGIGNYSVNEIVEEELILESINYYNALFK